MSKELDLNDILAELEKTLDELQKEAGVSADEAERNFVGNTHSGVVVENNISIKTKINKIVSKDTSSDKDEDSSLQNLTNIINPNLVYLDEIINTFLNYPDNRIVKLAHNIASSRNINVVDEDGNSILHYFLGNTAYWSGKTVGTTSMYISFLKKILDTSANPNLKNEDGNTPFHLATSTKTMNEEVLKLLIKYSGDPLVRNNSGDTPFSNVKNLMNDMNTSSFYHIIKNSQKYKNAMANLYAVLINSGMSGKAHLIQNDIEEADDPALGESQVCMMTYELKNEVMKAYLDAGAYVNAKLSKDDLTALQIAASNGNYKGAEILLEYGAIDETILPDSAYNLALKVRNNETAALIKYKKVSKKIFKSLISYGFKEEVDQIHFNKDIDAIDHRGETVLHKVIKGGYTAFLIDLLKLGFNLETRNADGYTPLMIAVSTIHDNPILVKAILDAGADASVKIISKFQGHFDSEKMIEKDILELAGAFNNWETVKVIKAHPSYKLLGYRGKVNRKSCIMI